VLLLSGVFAQSVNNPSAQKLNEFADTHADNEMAYLDLLAAALGKDPNARGYVIGYAEQRIPPGSFLMRVYGYRNYLINTRGIEPNRVDVVAGGIKDEISTELWLVPNGASAPSPASEPKVDPKSALIFDVAYPDCPPEFTVYLYELEDSLKFYVEALIENPNTQGWIVVYPGQRSGLSKAAKVARDAKNRLVKAYNVGADRLIARARDERRECTEVELWIVPTGTIPLIDRKSSKYFR